MNGLRALSFLFCASCLAAPAATHSNDDPIGERVQQRNRELIQAGYNLTCTRRLGKRSRQTSIDLKFFVREEVGEREILFWTETNQGETSFRLVGPDGNTVLSWSAHQGEKVTTLQLRPGKHVLEIESAGVDHGYALFGLKGFVIFSPDLDPTRFREVPASPADGFHWPYLLFVPRQIKVPCLLVIPNNTGFATDDMDLLRASASGEIQNESEMAERLGCPLLVPIFPRPVLGDSDLYLHDLSRDSLLTTVEAWKRVDLQLLQMLRSAQIHLEGRGCKIDPRILLWGFSAAGDFVNRFAMLHPDRVLAVAGGGIAWPIAPATEAEKESLRYPVGIADLEAVTGSPNDLKALRSVAWFLFRGADDKNDPLNFRGCFAEADADLIRRRFGLTPAERWTAATRLYAEARLPAHLVLYPGVGHSWTPAIREEVEQFFEKRLRETFDAPVSVQR
jgi:hypothetical protein